MNNHKKWIDKFHKKSPKIAKPLSFGVSTLFIGASSLKVAIPLFVAGASKMAGDKFGILQERGKKGDRKVIDIATDWVNCNNWLIDNWLPSKNWHINLPNNLNPNCKYLLICNHQSWVDTSIIQYISQNKLPLTRFFAKYELLYIPIVGQAFYLLDFPMMKRKPAKTPNDKLGRDLMEARRACRLLAGKPFVLLNYLEGTRFSPQKHKTQQSPYRHLLKPKAGGLALAISSLGDEIDGILDMTVVYPDGVPEYADLWRGNIDKLAVDIRPIKMDNALFLSLKNGDYHNKNADNYQQTKEELHAWLHQLWQQKDDKIDELTWLFVK